MQLIERRRRIEGTKIPAIIHNMQNFFIYMPVYEDGMIDCWDIVDLDVFEEKLNKKWVVTEVPTQSSISIHGLATFVIKSGKWSHSKISYLEYVKENIIKLNREFTNIYKITELEKRIKAERKVSFSSKANNFKIGNTKMYSTVIGDGFNIFYKHNNLNYLVELVVYKDAEIRLHNLPVDVVMDMDKANELFISGELFCEVKSGDKIRINNFATLDVSSCLYSAKSSEKFKELNDIIKKLNEKETTLQQCRKAYYHYLETPYEGARERLRELYEQVPEHQRIYLGDMDRKDSDYRRILFHPEKKREV
jgi:hypothetical protein